MKKQQILGSSMLFITSLIWGCAFVAQKVGMNHIGPFTFCGIRFLLSAVFLVIIVIARDLLLYKKLTLFTMDKAKRNKMLIGGALCGTSLAIATCFQQYSMQGTSAGKSGFITALYIVLVPVLGLVIKKKVKSIEWISVVIACISLFFLCFKKEELTDSFAINGYDLGLLVCAFFFSIQILLIDYFSKDYDCLMMATIQFVVCAFLCLIVMFIGEEPKIEEINKAILPLLYAGIASGGIAYTLQFMGQKRTNPVVASIIMSLEAVISLIAGAIIIEEKLSTTELIGCLLMFFAILLPQIPFRKVKRANSI